MERIAERRTGTINSMGTEWPVETVVYRNGPREWVVTYGICNGVADSSVTFRSKRAALEAAGIEED